MATLHVSVTNPKAAAGDTVSQLLYGGAPVIAEALTTSTTAASTTTIGTATTAYNQGKLVARCIAVDADHYVRVGGTASATNSYYVSTGNGIEIAIAPGQEISARTP